MSNKLDLFEIILKDDLKISLNSEEKTMLESIDDDVKQQLYELVKNRFFVDEIENTVKNIIKKSSDLSEEEQIDIRKKCQERVLILRNYDLLVTTSKSQVHK